MKEFLIIGNGRFCKNTIHHLLPGKISIALDGVANKLQSACIIPDIILGDLDSIALSALNFFKNKKVQIISAPNQDYTDLEKAIYFCDQLQARSIVLVCMLGGSRTDHSFMTLSSLKRYHSTKRNLRIVSDDVVQFICDEETVFEGTVGEKFSVFGFPEALVSSQGLKWELKDMKCILGQANSSCNEFIQETVVLKVKGEALVIHTFPLK